MYCWTSLREIISHILEKVLRCIHASSVAEPQIDSVEPNLKSEA
jgi:hypothetical protein